MLNMNKLFKHLLLLLILQIIILTNTYSQVDNSAITGASKKSKDTSAIEKSGLLMQESFGFLEKEIDPLKYIVGPNDLFLITIMDLKPIEFEAYISPEGLAVMPGFGTVDVKGLNLRDAKDKMLEQISQYKKGDDVYIALLQVRKFKVSLSGEVPKPLIVTATAVDRVSEVIDRALGMNFEASVRRIRLFRDGKYLQNVDLVKFYMTGNNEANPYVLGGDHIIIPPSNENEIIEIQGEVNSPGEFEFVEGDSLSTLIKIAQGFKNTADLKSVELVRTDLFGNTESFSLDLSDSEDIIRQESSITNDISLKPGDRIYVRKLEDIEDLYYAVITGEVKRPGKFAIEENKVRVSDLLERAGGFTDNASLEASQLIRQQELERKDPELERLKALSITEMSQAEKRYFQTKSRERKGVAAIDFNKIIDDISSNDNIYIQNMDSIHVPRKKDFINVQGRVNNPGIIPFKEGENYEYYISLAGGYGYRADEDETFVTKSKGEYFLAKNEDYILEPGDVILIPPKEELSFMEIFTTSLTIITQIFTIAGVIFSLVRL